MREGHAGVRLMNDYCCWWPLWWVEGGQVEPDELQLSDDLDHKARALAAHFNEHFDPFSHWDTDGARVRHALLAREVEAGLVLEVGHDLEIRADLWELAD